MPTYTDHLGLRGTQNPGGMQQLILYAAFADFDAMQDLPTSGASPGDYATIAGDHTFQVGEGWKKLYTSRKVANLVATGPELSDVTGADIAIPAFHPGSSPVFEEFILFAQTDDFIFLVRQQDGSYIQIGLPNQPAGMRRVDYQTGTATTERRGYNLELFCDMPLLPTYTGVITLKT